jgi:hypothetical protein
MSAPGLDPLTIPRQATCTAAEHLEVLEIDKIVYRNILIGQLQENLDEKLNFFETLLFFDDIDRVELVPLASNIDVRHYQMGEKILE